MSTFSHHCIAADAAADAAADPLSSEPIKIIKSDGQKTATSRICTTAQLKKDYEHMVVRSRTQQWKLKLEMIQEGKEKKHKPRFSNSFGIKRRRSNSSRSEPQFQSQLQSQSGDVTFLLKMRRCRKMLR